MFDERSESDRVRPPNSQVFDWCAFETVNHSKKYEHQTVSVFEEREIIMNLNEPQRILMNLKLGLLCSALLCSALL